MVYLLVMYCLHATSVPECKPMRVPVEMTMIQCALYGQVAAREMLPEGATLMSYRCETGENT